MALNGLYARLYSMQFRDPEEELSALKAKVSLPENRYEEEKAPKRPTGLLSTIFGGD